MVDLAVQTILDMITHPEIKEKKESQKQFDARQQKIRDFLYRQFKSEKFTNKTPDDIMKRVIPNKRELTFKGEKYFDDELTSDFQRYCVYCGHKTDVEPSKEHPLTATKNALMEHLKECPSRKEIDSSINDEEIWENMKQTIAKKIKNHYFKLHYSQTPLPLLRFFFRILNLCKLKSMPSILDCYAGTGRIIYAVEKEQEKAQTMKTKINSMQTDKRKTMNPERVRETLKELDEEEREEMNYWFGTAVTHEFEKYFDRHYQPNMNTPYTIIDTTLNDTMKNILDQQEIYCIKTMYDKNGFGFNQEPPKQYAMMINNDFPEMQLSKAEKDRLIDDKGENLIYGNAEDYYRRGTTWQEKMNFGWCHPPPYQLWKANSVFSNRIDEVKSEYFAVEQYLQLVKGHIVFMLPKDYLENPKHNDLRQFIEKKGQILFKLNVSKDMFEELAEDKSLYLFTNIHNKLGLGRKQSINLIYNHFMSSNKYLMANANPLTPIRIKMSHLKQFRVSVAHDMFGTSQQARYDFEYLNFFVDDEEMKKVWENRLLWKNRKYITAFKENFNFYLNRIIPKTENERLVAKLERLRDNLSFLQMSMKKDDEGKILLSIDNKFSIENEAVEWKVETDIGVNDINIGKDEKLFWDYTENAIGRINENEERLLMKMDVLYKKAVIDFIKRGDFPFCFDILYQGIGEIIRILPPDLAESYSPASQKFSVEAFDGYKMPDKAEDKIAFRKYRGGSSDWLINSMFKRFYKDNKRKFGVNYTYKNKNKLPIGA